MMGSSARDSTLGQLLDSLSSGQSSSGSGTAVAIALALSAACAHKALALTQKHQDLCADTRSAMQALQDIIRQSLESADRDAASFSAFLRSHDRPSAERLMESDRQTQQLGVQLQQILQQIADKVTHLARGDISCADRLLRAAVATQAEISAENARAVNRALDAR